MKKGRVLGRSPSHRKALMRNLACALFLTERDIEETGEEKGPAEKGRIITTVAKAKEVRGFVERCITIARKALVHEQAARAFATTAQRHSPQWQQWRKSDQWRKWAQAKAPAVAARRRLRRLLGASNMARHKNMRSLGSKQAVKILIDVIAPRFVDRPGGYTRVLKLSKPRLGDAGPRAILELVGKNDRAVRRPETPAFEGRERGGETQQS
jgi:large subunit ribosomal protein L17